MEFTYETKRIRNILLDPNNYRFLDLPGWRRRQENRFHNSSVQTATLRLLEENSKYNLDELRTSILANGYISLERIVVTPYQYAEDHLLVIEGNRRIAALKTLIRDNDDGVLTLNETQIEQFSNIPIAILNPEEQGLLSAHHIIMGIRHISGPQEWGAYQQAFLIKQLVDDEGKDFDDIAEHMNISPYETRRRYRAIKALAAMQDDEIYSSVAKPQFYRFFHELVSITNVREFFSWDHDNTRFTDNERARLFFEMIEPIESEQPPKIRTYLDVRTLRSIIGNISAEAVLIDPDQTLAAAIAITQPDPNVQTTADIVSQANRFRLVIESAQIDSIAGLTQDEIQNLEEISNLIISRIEQYRRLSQ